MGGCPCVISLNIDASTLGWDHSWDPLGHSAFSSDPYPEIYQWWKVVFAGGGDAANAAVPIGNEES